MPQPSQLPLAPMAAPSPRPIRPRLNFRPSVQLVLLLVAADSAAAQPSGSDNSGNYNSVKLSPSMGILLAVLVTAFFFIGFFSIYLRNCGNHSGSTAGASRAAGGFVGDLGRSRRQMRGLDPEVLAKFPLMKYTEARELHAGKEELECAVCLSEFAGDDELRMLPKCSHVFHPDCIDTWLATHVTCPVCRRNLAEDAAAEAAQPTEAAVAIDVVGEGNEEDARRSQEMAELERIGSERRAARLPRAHSTGHSLAVRRAGGDDRYTLRLPEEVRREIVACGDDGSRRGRRTVARSVRLGRSGRWPSFLMRTTSSVRGATTTEGSDGLERAKLSSSVRAVRGGPLDCIGARSCDDGEEEEAPMAVASRQV